METTRQSRQGDVTRRVENFRAAYEARDIDRTLELFADDAEYTLAPGAFGGKPAIRKLLEWDARLSPTATIRDTGIKMLVRRDGRVGATARPDRGS
jgi:ketosteroid isomerase-like protein